MSIPNCNGLQYSHLDLVQVLDVDVAGGAVAVVGAGTADVAVGGAACAVACDTGALTGALVSLSLANVTTSFHMRGWALTVSFALLMVSNSAWVAWSSRALKQWSVASSLAAMDRLSYSTRSTKLGVLSPWRCTIPKKRSLSWWLDNPKSRLTTSRKCCQE